MYNGTMKTYRKKQKPHALCRPLQAENAALQRRLEEQTARLGRAEGQSEDRGRRVGELERLLGSMVDESAGLKKKVAAGEVELGRLRERTVQGREEQQRYAAPRVEVTESWGKKEVSFNTCMVLKDT